MPHRTTMPLRPWLDGATYDKYDTPNTIHFDLYAYTGEQDRVYFEYIMSERGKREVRRVAWEYFPLFDVWREVAALPTGLVRLYWRRETHDTFKRVHGHLLALCVTPPQWSARTVLCHYVKPYDADPWPRGTLNTWRPYEYREGKRPGRPRISPTPTAPEPTVTEATRREIDILMGVDVLDNL